MKTFNDNALTLMLSRIKRILDRMKTSVDGNNNLMAVFARNIGDMEGQVEDNTDAITQAQTDLAEQVTQAQTDLEEHVDQYMGTIADDAADAIAEVDAAVGQFDGRLEQMNQAIALVSELNQTMEEADLNRLNRPNLLKQNYFERYDEPTSEEVPIEITILAETAEEIGTPLTFTYPDARITAQTELYGDWVDTDEDIIRSADVRVTCLAGQAVVTIPPRLKVHTEATVVSFMVCEHAIRTIIYGQTARVIGHDRPYLKNYSGRTPSERDADPDTVSVQLVELTGDDVITEPDEEVYDTALEFTVSEASTAYGNVEELQYKYGSYGAGTFTDTAPQEYGNITELQVGETYTMSCWARVTDGEKALIRMAYDPVKRSGDAFREWIEVSSPTWKRIHWTFTFDQTGNQFTDTETTKEVDGQTVAATQRVANWTKTIGFGVSRKYAGTVQLCGFRLTAGGLHMSTLFDQHSDDIADLKERVSALEALVLENMGN